MEPIIYAMQFRGEGRPAEAEGGLRVSGRAHGCTITTGVGSNGEIRARVQAAGSEIAEFESLVIPCGEDVFEESGSISFDEGASRLRFETIGTGHLQATTQTGVQQGSVSWRIVEGTGQFEGATGLITSNFTLSDGRQVVDYQVGVIYPKA
jgi:hypothetical protein